MEQTCSTCHHQKPLTEEHFHRRGAGWRRQCKACRNGRDLRRVPDRTPSPPRLIVPAVPAVLTDHARVQVDMVRAKVLLVLFDLHAPDHDPLFWAAFVQFVRELQPDEVILAGDFLELGSMSMHAFNDGMAAFETDVAVGYAMLRELREAAPRCALTYLEGNHETRLQRFLMQHAPALLGAVTLREKLRLDELGVTWLAEAEQPTHRGTVDILHGHQLGSGAKGMLPKYHTAKACQVYGAPGRTVIYGHVHYAQESGHTNYHGRTSARSFGCARKLQPRWLQGSPSGWEHEFAHVTVGPGDLTSLYAVKPVGGQFLFNGRLYAGRTSA